MRPAGLLRDLPLAKLQAAVLRKTSARATTANELAPRVTVLELGADKWFAATSNTLICQLGFRRDMAGGIIARHRRSGEH